MKRLPEILKTGGRRCRTLVLEGFYVWCVSTTSSNAVGQVFRYRQCGKITMEK